MTTDRELLELAAKAGGIDPRRLPHAWPERFDDDQWDPLIDDGDALRLVVKLRLRLTVAPAEVRIAWLDHILDPKQIHMPVCDDPYAATRRAIVRAAAEIGRSMK